MKSFKSILWGLALVVVGVILALNSLDIVNINLFFNGWWTLFIIIPSFVDLITDEDKTGSIIGLIIGTVLLLACNKVIDFELIWKLLLPVIIIVIGLSIIFKNSIMKKTLKNVKTIPKNGECTAIFSGEKLNYNEEKFEGCNLTAIFGGIELDLTNSKIEEDVAINVTTVFGGVDIKVPNNCKVKVTSSSIFGGADNKVKNNIIDENSKTIYVNANCTFGGVDIKC